MNPQLPPISERLPIIVAVPSGRGAFGSEGAFHFTPPTVQARFCSGCSGTFWSLTTIECSICGCRKTTVPLFTPRAVVLMGADPNRPWKSDPVHTLRSIGLTYARAFLPHPELFVVYQGDKDRGGVVVDTRGGLHASWPVPRPPDAVLGAPWPYREAWVVGHWLIAEGFATEVHAL